MFSCACVTIGVVLQLSAVLPTVESSVSCKDPNNNDVDWFIMYKVPKAELQYGVSTKGDEFAYIDPSTSPHEDAWKISSQSILTSDNPLAYSLAPLFWSQARLRRDLPSEGREARQRRRRRRIGYFPRPLSGRFKAGKTSFPKHFSSGRSRPSSTHRHFSWIPKNVFPFSVITSIQKSPRNLPISQTSPAKRQKGVYPAVRVAAAVGSDVRSTARSKTKTREEEEEERRRRKDTLMYVLYNDQAPHTYGRRRNGHSKGIVISDSRTGVWIQHSIPGFLDVAAGRYVFPTNGLRNAQMVMCITFRAPSAVDKIARHLRLHYANVYYNSAPSKLSQTYPNMHELLRGNYLTLRALSGIAPYRDDIWSLRGTRFVSVSKRATWNIGSTGQSACAFVVSWRWWQNWQLRQD